VKERVFLLGLLLLVTLNSSSPLASQTWHAGGLPTPTLELPGNCSSTWYDPDVFVYPDGQPGFLAQGGLDGNTCTANAGLDSLYRAKFNGTTWQIPLTKNECPTLRGNYSILDCENQDFAPHQPLASPAVVKVGSRYYMAFSGGNADIRKGHLFWATSTDGLSWTTLKWNPKPAGFDWKPLIYPKHGDFCGRFGIPQIELTYDPSTTYGPQGTFYLHFNYHHSTGELDTFTFRFNYSDANGFGLGGGMQVCLNGGARGTPCNWVNHSGAMVFDYDGQPADPGDPLLIRYGSNQNNFDYGSGSIVWNPLHNNWLRVFSLFDTNLRWQTATSLSSGVWTAPQIVDMSQFDSRMLTRHATYNASERYYGGLWWGTLGARTGMWLFQPSDHASCPNAFTGLGITAVALNFS
jgi:hypothetical protein